MFKENPPTEQPIPLVNIAQELSPIRATQLGNFLSDQIKPPEWSPELWDYLRSGLADQIEVSHLLELRVAFGEPVLDAIEMCDGELMSVLELMFFMSVMDDLVSTMFGGGR